MAISFDTAIGAGLAAFRHSKGWRQEDLAQRAREAGLPWTRATIAAIERGRREIGLAEGMRLTLALQQPLGRLIVPDLDEIEVTGHVMKADILRKMLPGLHPSVREWYEGERPAIEVDGAFDLMKDYGLDTDQALQAAASASESEEIIARRLQGRGVPATAFDVAHAALSLWGRTLAVERDHRLKAEAGEGSERVRRGHITRGLAKEIEARVREVRKVP